MLGSNSEVVVSIDWCNQRPRRISAAGHSTANVAELCSYYVLNANYSGEPGTGPGRSDKIVIY